MAPSSKTNARRKSKTTKCREPAETVAQNWRSSSSQAVAKWNVSSGKVEYEQRMSP